MEDDIQKLRDYLAGVAPGPVNQRAKSEIERKLSAAWEHIDSSQGGMEGYKLIDRTENMAWLSPLLTFQIERHGAVVYGSVCAEIQSWTIDVQNGAADFLSGPQCMVGKRETPLDLAPMADSIALLVVCGAKSGG